MPLIVGHARVPVQHSRHPSRILDDNVGTPARRMAERSRRGPQGRSTSHAGSLGLAPADCSKIAGVAVLLALYPGRTDVIDMPGTTPLPQTTDCSVWVKILLRVFSCRNSLALVMDPIMHHPWAHFRALQRSIGLDIERISRLQKVPRSRQ